MSSSSMSQPSLCPVRPGAHFIKPQKELYKWNHLNVLLFKYLTSHLICFQTWRHNDSVQLLVVFKAWRQMTNVKLGLGLSTGLTWKHLTNKTFNKEALFIFLAGEANKQKTKNIMILVIWQHSSGNGYTLLKTDLLTVNVACYPTAYS